MDSFGEEEPKRLEWPVRRPNLEFDDGDYDQKEDTKPKPPRRRKKLRRRANSFIDAEAGVDKVVSVDEVSEDENNNLDGYIVADDVEF